MLRTDTFSLDFDDAWSPEHGESPGTYRLTSEKYRTMAVINGALWSPSDPEGAAARYLATRIAAEREQVLDAGRAVEIEESVGSRPYGTQIEYFGYDSEGREFRFWGVGTAQKVVSVYVESYDQSADGVQQILASLLAGLRT